MECAIPVTSHSSGTTRYFDLARAVPGAILTPPSLSDDVEIWTAGEAREIAWLYYKGNLPLSVSSNGRSNSHEELDTAFRIDLLRTGESLLREVMSKSRIFSLFLIGVRKDKVKYEATNRQCRIYRTTNTD